MGRTFRISFTLLFTFSYYFTVAQNHKYILLEKGNSRHKIRIYPGEQIRFKFTDDRHFTTLRIKDLVGRYILIEHGIFPLEYIEEIDISDYKRRYGLLNAMGEKLPFAGLGYIMIDQFNRTVVQNQPWEYDQKVIRTGAIMVGIGLILKLTSTKKFKINKKNKISIVDLGGG